MNSAKYIKQIVGGSALLAIGSVFQKWIVVSGNVPDNLADSVPASGLANGGAVFIAVLLLPLVAAAIGSAKRFGRGLSGLALAGSLIAWLLGFAKLADISRGAQELSQVLGGNVTLSAATGYYVFLLATTATVIASIAGLVKPEPKPAPRVAPAVQPA